MVIPADDNGFSMIFSTNDDTVGPTRLPRVLMVIRATDFEAIFSFLDLEISSPSKIV